MRPREAPAGRPVRCARLHSGPLVPGKSRALDRSSVYTSTPCKASTHPPFQHPCACTTYAYSTVQVTCFSYLSLCPCSIWGLDRS